MQVEERHQYRVPYVNEGDDATVSYYNNEDFRFTNTLDVLITIYASAEDDKVTVFRYNLQHGKWHIRFASSSDGRE